MSPDPSTAQVDAALLWRLHEVAEAATEVALEHQSPRLRTALATLVSVRIQSGPEQSDD